MSHRRLPVLPWIWGWGAVVLAFPWSNAFMSVATGLLGLTALLKLLTIGSVDKKPDTRAKALSAAGLGLMLLVAWSGVSGLWGGSIAECLHDVRVKLPLAAGGLAMMAMSRDKGGMPRKDLDTVLKLAVASAFAATIALVVRDILDGGMLGGRQASRFISHIRFGLWWALLLPWVANMLNRRWSLFCLIGAVTAWSWIQGLTGLMLGIVLIPWWWSGMANNAGSPIGERNWPESRRIRKTAFSIVLLSLPFVVLVAWALPTSLPDPAVLPEQTKEGAPYMHKLDRSVTENGYFIWTCISWGELQAGWSRRSYIPMPEIQGALVRFLTSKDLSKDKDGVAALNDEEVAAIERGIPSVVELKGSGWEKRWNRFKFNWGEWWDGRRSPDASILARSVYARTGFSAWLSLPPDRWVVGCGSGQVESVMDQAYAEQLPDWPAEGRKRPHFQYVTLLLGLGFVGVGLFLWILLAMWAHPPARPGILLIALSCLAEDTLETQAGVTLAFVGLALGAFIHVRKS